MNDGYPDFEHFITGLGYPSIGYPELISTTVNWLPSDTEELFLENLHKHKTNPTFIAGDWINQPVSYTFNQYGFRSMEFDFNSPNNSIMFLGCSFTVGVGLRLEDVYCTKVADDLGLSCYNLGIGGGSGDLCFRLGSFWIPKLKPKYVVYMEPDIHRLEIKTDDMFDQWLAQEYNDPRGVYFQNWLLHNENAELQSQRNTNALNNVCTTNNAIMIKASRFFKGNDLAGARDMMHHGPKAHEIKSQEILNQIKEADQVK